MVRRGGVFLTREVQMYVPTEAWLRNYKRMKNDKLLGVLSEFDDFARYPGSWVPDAVRRVMDHGGCIETNHAACREEAIRRGLIAS